MHISAEQSDPFLTESDHTQTQVMQQESSTVSLVKTVTTHMGEKLAGLLKSNCQSTEGTTKIEKLRDQG